MAAMLADNVEEEYLWATSLTSAKKEVVWDPKDAEEGAGDGIGSSHRLLIKTAILMPEAKEGEVTIVEVETVGFNKTKVKVPLVAMKGGIDLQKYVDILLPAAPASIKIVQGNGPVHLVGSHCVERMIEDRDDEGEEEEAEDDDDTSDEKTTNKKSKDKA